MQNQNTLFKSYSCVFLDSVFLFYGQSSTGCGVAYIFLLYWFQVTCSKFNPIGFDSTFRYLSWNAAFPNDPHYQFVICVDPGLKKTKGKSHSIPILCQELQTKTRMADQKIYSLSLIRAPSNDSSGANYFPCLDRDINTEIEIKT